mmetsp:Transcript_11005/g.16619  ORF Transcript_11005/g.16619 Transcript_11005/m.16619 type:complete len:884 (-) Transcript_11005:209-2860(-)
MSSFIMPTGASADIKELEYIAALQQTQKVIRTDGTVSGADILLFLKSKYGIVMLDSDADRFSRAVGGFLPAKVEEESAKPSGWLKKLKFGGKKNKDDAVVDTEKPTGAEEVKEEDNYDGADNAGNEEEEDPLYLDIVQMLSLLMIPQLLLADDENSADQDVVQRVLSSMLTSIGDTESGGLEEVELSEALVWNLLMSRGEKILAEDKELVKAMVESAGGAGCKLNKESFAKALTSDVMDFKKHIDMTSPTDVFQDIWGFHLAQSVSKGPTCDSKIEDALKEKNDDNQFQYSFVKTATSLDSALGSFRSFTYQLYLWVFNLTFLLYVNIGYGETLSGINCWHSHFMCDIANNIWFWFTLGLVFWVTAALVFIPVSLGNMNDPDSWLPLISSLCLLGYSLTGYINFMVHPTERAQEIVDSFVLYGPLMTLNLVISVILFVDMVSYPIGEFWNKRDDAKEDGESYYLSSFESRPYTFGVPTFKLKSDKKLAAIFKTSRLINNALQLHKKPDTDKYALKESEVMREYVLRGSAHEENTASLVWTWKNIWSRSLFWHEGIWFHSRLLVGQVTMIITTCLIFALMIHVTSNMVDTVEEWRADIVDDSMSSASEFASKAIPKKGDVILSSIVGISVSMVVAITLISLQIPSTVSTILKYRTGVMPTLHDPFFTAKYRNNADLMFYNVANQLYALLGSMLLFWFLGGLAVFIYIWELTRDGMKALTALCIGLVVTILMKMVVVGEFRKRYNQAFHRTNPAAANVVALLMESWQLGLGAGVALSRFAIFLLAAAFWLGRIDEVFLAENVRIGTYAFDLLPFHFRKEIFVYEAHTHPYIERLGSMYLMKLKYGDTFINDAGSAWRRLFVNVLVPWTAKMRMKRRSISEGDEED